MDLENKIEAQRKRMEQEKNKLDMTHRGRMKR